MAVDLVTGGVTVPAMYEFDSVSVSSYEAAALAAKLSEKSADGWEVVAIIPAGSDVVAFVKRSKSGADAASDSAAAGTTATSDVTPPEVAAAGAAAAAPAASEPAGWGSAPASSGSSWGSGTSNDSGSSWGGASTTAATDTSSGWGSGAAPAAAGAASTPAQPAQPSVPAGWYHDPAGRYELRYWDGSAWTEHVSRAGQQYTDPPVA
jgi:hypothetical protein